MSTYRSCIVTTSGLLSLTMLGGLVLSSIFVSADTEVIDEVRLTVPVACTMSGTGTTHTATLNPGTYSGASGNEYENGIGKTTLTAICNDDNGFSIYAIGFTGNEYGVTNLVGQNTSGTIATKAYESGDTTSNWSMKLTKVDNPVSGDPVAYNPENLTISTGYNTWHAVPADYTKVAEYHASTGSSTTDTTLGVKLETTYAAYIASNQAADTYVGQVKYIMVHPYNMDPPLHPQSTEAGCIRYYPNGSNVEGTMGCQLITDSDTEISLLASNFSRQDYGFAGWSDVFDYTTNTSAHFYGPQEAISFAAGQYTGSNPGLSLYAVWVKSQGNLQDTSKVTTVCNNLTQAPTDGTANLSSVSALTDQRDNEIYAIAKLADGNCWMIENLRLEAENTRSVENNALAQGYGRSTTYGNFSGLADAENSFNAGTGATDATIANSLYYAGTQEGTASINISQRDYAGFRMPRYNNLNTPSDVSFRPLSPVDNVFEENNTTVGLYSYGNYYTWAAALANTIFYKWPSYSDSNGKTSETVGTSLCPAGWRLPRGGTTTARPTADFYVLSKSLMKDDTGASIEPNKNNMADGYGYYDSTQINVDGDTADKAFRKFPNNFLYSGNFILTSSNYRGSKGYYWSSTSDADQLSYSLSLSNTSVRPGNNGMSKLYGDSIRCVMAQGV